MLPDDRLQQLAELLRGFRFAQHTERALQDGIESVLHNAGIPYSREHQLSPNDRPDFFVDPGVCIEVKIGGPTSEVARQITRYAAHPDVEAVLLVTTRRQHQVPAEIDNKPVATLFVGSAFL